MTSNFRKLRMLNAAPRNSEDHVASFFGQTAEWYPVQKYLLFGPVAKLRVKATDAALFWRGHVTSQRLILEPSSKLNMSDMTGSLAKVIASTVGGRAMESAEHFLAMGKEAAEEMKRQLSTSSFLEFKWNEIDFCARSTEYFWLIPHDSPIQAGIPFIPRTIDERERPDAGLRAAECADDFSNMIARFCTVRTADSTVSLE